MRIEISHDIVKRIGTFADELNIEVYVVGGYVRDTLLEKQSQDIDIVVIGDGILLAKQVAEKFGLPSPVVFERFGTALISLDGGKIEFVSARKEKYTKQSRKPIIKKAALESDLSRRDFTINAIAASLNKNRFGEIIDPFNGINDLRKKIIRTPLDPVKTFDDDPLRMLRAIRFATQLHFQILPDTLDAIAKIAERINIVSKERITDEFLKILASSQPSIGLILLQQNKLIKYIFPELDELVGVEQRKDYHHKDVFWHTMKVVDNIATLSDNIWLRFAALMHDIAKPLTKSFKADVGWTFHGHEELGARKMKPIFRRMRLPMDKLPYVEKLIRLHLRPMVLVNEEITDSAIRRLLLEAGEEIDDLMLLCRADITSQNPRRVAEYLKNYDNVIQKMKTVEENDRLRNWQPPVRGHEIMQVCGLEPGPLVGKLKKMIEEAILEGIIPNEHDDALQYLIENKDRVLQEYIKNE